MKINVKDSLPREAAGYVMTYESEKSKPVKAFYSDAMHDWRDKDGLAVKVAFWEKDNPAQDDKGE